MALRVVAGLASALGGLASSGRTQEADVPPPLPREFRAAWVATVANIDWPSKPGLPTDRQKDEAIRILDRAAALNLNAVVFQVRPCADALYESKLEPWSAYLTGTQGKRPEPYYDPLAFWVEEAHRRGLQLHAWFNPFRARLDAARYDESADHISKTRPELAKRYDKFLWLDPGEPDAREHSYRVFLDVARRYDVDGIHVDDYFYPYPVPDPSAEGRELEFPDEPSWQAYRSSGGTLARADWRRRNINELIERIYRGIKAEKPAVLFGISPFGIPRPGQPEGVKGFDQYDKLYADAVLWLREGWCDYFSPQLYWKIDAPGQPFRPLLGYWIGVNPRGRHIWPGLSVSRVSSSPIGYAPEEILGQVAILRETRGASGEVLFSMKALMAGHREIGDRLKQGPYATPALVPASPWLGLPMPGRPAVEVERRGDEVVVSAKGGGGAAPFLWAASVRRGSEWSLSLHPAQAGPIAIKEVEGRPASAVVVAAVDRSGNMSEPVVVPLSASSTK